MAEFVETIAEALQQLVILLGPAGIALVALLENLFPPTPSEFLYPLAGKLAYDGHVQPAIVVLAGMLGSLAGAILYYLLGYRLGDRRIRGLIAQYGQFCVLGRTIRLTSVEEYDRAMRLFEQNGGIIVFVARLMPLVHGVVSIPAGVIRMNPVLFLLYTALGAAAWIAPLTLLGYWLGSNWECLLYWLDVYETIWYILIGVALIVYIYRRLRSRHSDSNIAGSQTREEA